MIDEAVRGYFRGRFPPVARSYAIASRRYAALLAALVLAAGCDRGIYVRDGVTDGDTFYLSPQVLEDDDPVLQSWAGYSLSLSACKLAIGNDNPARASSFDCERTARRHLVEAWEEHRVTDPALSDAYLDALTAVRAAGWLDEYVVRYFGRPEWQPPADLDMAGFRDWMSHRYPKHRPRTRITGSWNYAAKVRVVP